MRETLIAAAIAVLGAGATTALAQPTLDFSPNRAWRNAPESTAAETRREGATGKGTEGATEERQPANEHERPTR